MKKYNEPKLEIFEIVECSGCICASFDSYNDTEKWVIDPDTETI